MAFKPKPGSEMDNGVRFQEEDAEVDIMECVNLRDDEFQEKGEEVLCEASSSSSFGDSMCARDADDFGFGFGDEAESILSKDYPLPDAAEFLGLTKKKTTNLWKRLTKPLMWRCKWLELKVKEIRSQARGYEKEVQDYDLTKQFNLEKSKLEGFDGKLIPFRHQTQRKNVFKRGRRKRVEETTDLAAYMSSHNIFSYTDKRVPVNVKAQYPVSDLGTGRKATGKQDGTEDDCLLSELDCSDNSLPMLLCKIDEAQSKVRRMRKRVDQLTLDSQTAHTSLIPQKIAPCHGDFTIQNGKQCAVVEDPLTRNQRKASVQTDHIKHMLVPQTPPTQIGGKCSTIGEHLLMDDKEMNKDDMEENDEELEYFRKLINELTGAESPEEENAEEDPTRATKRRRTSH